MSPPNEPEAKRIRRAPGALAGRRGPDASCRAPVDPSRARLLDQPADVLGGEAAGEQVAVVHDPAEQGCLAARERDDLLLDRVAGDHPVDHHRARLADAVGAVDRLRLDRGVPPRVEQEAVVGLAQVQAEAAGLEADQKPRVVARLKALHDAVATARPAVEVAVADPLPGQAVAHPGEEACELAEDERAVSRADDVAELLAKRAELGAREGFAALVDERGVDAELAQQRDRAQDREAVAIEVAEQPEDLLALALEVGFVEPVMARV